MKDLVYFSEVVGEYVTDSLLFAEYVKSRHSTIINRIRRVHYSVVDKENLCVMFAESEYITARNDKALKFLITKKGFNALARAFKKDADYTEYEEAFDAVNPVEHKEYSKSDTTPVVLRTSEVILKIAEELVRHDTLMSEMEESLNAIKEQIKSYLPKPAPSEEDLFRKDDTIRDIIRKKVADHCDKFDLDYGTIWGEIYKSLRLQGYVFTGTDKSKLIEAEKRGWLGHILSAMEKLGIK